MDFRSVRKYIYSVLPAIGAVLAFYGLMTNEEVALWSGVVGALLSGSVSGLALKNLTPSGSAPVEIDESELDSFEESTPKHAAE